MLTCILTLPNCFLVAEPGAQGHQPFISSAFVLALLKLLYGPTVWDDLHYQYISSWCLQHTCSASRLSTFSLCHRQAHSECIAVKHIQIVSDCQQVVQIVHDGGAGTPPWLWSTTPPQAAASRRQHASCATHCHSYQHTPCCPRSLTPFPTVPCCAQQQGGSGVHFRAPTISPSLQQLCSLGSTRPASSAARTVWHASVSAAAAAAVTCSCTATTGLHAAGTTWASPERPPAAAAAAPAAAVCCTATPATAATATTTAAAQATAATAATAGAAAEA